MIKKITIVILLVSALFLLCGCDNSSDQYNSYGFIIINNSYNGNNLCSICYDPASKVCYIFIEFANRVGLSPYYILNEDGKPEIGVYGQNVK